MFFKVLVKFFVINFMLYFIFSNSLISLVESLCDGHLDCNDLLTIITGCLSLSHSHMLIVSLSGLLLLEYSFGSIFYCCWDLYRTRPYINLNSNPLFLDMISRCDRCRAYSKGIAVNTRIALSQKLESHGLYFEYKSKGRFSQPFDWVFQVVGKVQ